MLKKILRLLFRNQIILKKFKLQNNKKLKWYISPDSQLKYLKSNFELELEEFVIKYLNNNMVIWDVGANCGTFTALTISYFKNIKITAFEPDIFLGNVLLKNAIKYNFDVIICALGKNISINNLQIAQNGRASNTLDTSLGYAERGGIRYTQKTIVLTLDYLTHIYGDPDFIKIDVEGSELDVIEGALKLISRKKIQILIEINPDKFHSINDIFKKFSYEYVEVFPNNYLFY